MTLLIIGVLLGIIGYLLCAIIKLRHKRLDYLWTIQSFEDQTTRLFNRCESQQARIDSLMFEYEPDSMTDLQLDNYERHQNVARD